MEAGQKLNQEKSQNVANKSLVEEIKKFQLKLQEKDSVNKSNNTKIKVIVKETPVVCPWCKKIKKKSLLTNHLRKCKFRVVVCDLCKREIDPSDYDEHRISCCVAKNQISNKKEKSVIKEEVEKDNEDFVKCPICNAMMTQKELNSHFMPCGQKLKNCSGCGQDIIAIMFDSHEKECTANSIVDKKLSQGTIDLMEEHAMNFIASCPLCPMKFTIGMTNNHITQCKKNYIKNVKLSCLLCKEESLAIDMAGHVMKCKDNSYIIRCPSCKFQILANEMQTHFSNCSQNNMEENTEFTCFICKAEFDISIAKDHIDYCNYTIIKTMKLACSMCKKKFLFDKIYNHILECSQNVEERIKVTCSTCKVELLVNEINDHAKNCYQNKNTKYAINSISGDQYPIQEICQNPHESSCPWCTNVFSSNEIDSHVETCVNRQEECLNCGKPCFILEKKKHQMDCYETEKETTDLKQTEQAESSVIDDEATNFEDQFLKNIQLNVCKAEVIQKDLDYLYFRFQILGCSNVQLALHVITRAMFFHTHEKDIQISGSKLLLFIIKNNDLYKFQPNIKKRRLIVEALLFAMSVHKEDVMLLRNGCLSLLFFNIPDLVFVHERLVNILLTIVMAQDQDDDVQYLATKLLNHFVCQLDKHQKLLVGHSGIIKITIQLIRQRVSAHRCDNGMEIAWSILWNITDETPINCEKFLDQHGMTLFLDCLQAFPEEDKLLAHMMGPLSNIAEVKELRPILMKNEYISVFSNLLNSKYNCFELSYNVTGILSHIASDGPELWKKHITSVKLEDVLTNMNKTIRSWKLETEFDISYRSFEPIFCLLNTTTPESQLWPVWTLANRTKAYPETYCILLQKEGGLELLQKLDCNCKDEIQILIRITLKQYDDFAGGKL